MNVLFIFTSSLFFLWVLRELFFWLAIWQENEYRQDRFFASLKKKSRRSKLLFIFWICKWLLFFSYGFIIFNDDLLTPYQYIVILFYLLQSFLLLRDIYMNHLKKPALTFRAVLVIGLTLATVLLIFALPLLDRFFWLLFIDLFIPIIIFFYVSIFLFPIEIYSDWQIEKAVRKIRIHPDLLVITVTGSIGKSLTKDYLAALLKRKFTVIKTEGKDNTAIGIARTILKKLESDTQIFVAEISAYQRGEISMLCKLIKPKIGVLTPINNHYLSLFKSLENIKKTNFELVESLPKQGFCLFNGNNKNTMSLYNKSRKAKVLYSTSRSVTPEFHRGKAITAYRLTHKQKQTTCIVRLKDEDMQLKMQPSVHIDQLLPAIYIASHLGMSEREVKREVALLR